MSKHPESSLCVLSTGRRETLAEPPQREPALPSRQNGRGNARPSLRGCHTSPNGHGNERRTEKKSREKGIISEAFLTPPRFFCFIGSIVSLWVSYTTGAFCTACQSLQFGFISMQFPVSLAQPREPSPLGFREAACLKRTFCKMFCLPSTGLPSPCWAQ